MHGVGIKPGPTRNSHQASLILRYRRRLIRKRLTFRAFRKRRELHLVQDNRAKITRTSTLCFTTFRNEALRLSYFLTHYRALGVDHFFMVDNGSDDDSRALLEGQPDITLYESHASYRASRFGVDWLNWLKWKYAHNHWVVVADADELLVYPNHDRWPLPELTRWLEARHQHMMGALMLDMYPKDAPDTVLYDPTQNPTEVLNWFDAYGYWAQRQPKLDNLWLQGGPRARMFFANSPERAPTLNKIPLIKWKRGYAFVNSTHSILPARLNHVWQTDISGVLLHTKFLPGTAERARLEAKRDEHFGVGSRYLDYYDALAQNPCFWYPGSTKYEGWKQLVELGLMRQSADNAFDRN